MLNLIRAEWLKLTKRPLTWVLLIVFLALLVMYILSLFTLVNLALALGMSGQGTERGAQIEEYAHWIVYPGLFGCVFAHINSLGGVFAVILAAGAMGSEYGWGTLRTQLARHPNRARYLSAKLLTLMALLAVGMILSLLLGSGLGAALGLLAGGAGVPSAGDLAVLPLAILRALFALLPYVLLTVSFAILGRSVLVGLAGGLLYLVFEVGFGTLAILQVFGGVWQTIYNLTIQRNISALTVLNLHVFGLHPERLTSADLFQAPSVLQASLVVTIYCVGFFATALYLLRRRDITGAA
ncbi:MAG TPA: ABC transporter permease subunit [Roseiflexaceae bacterium]|nr:ABC transporter permease subunit [Roseiflexaceae bacterium]